MVILNLIKLTMKTNHHFMSKSYFYDYIIYPSGNHFYFFFQQGLTCPRLDANSYIAKNSLELWIILPHSAVKKCILVEMAQQLRAKGSSGRLSFQRTRVQFPGPLILSINMATYNHF